MSLRIERLPPHALEDARNLLAGACAFDAAAAVAEEKLFAGGAQGRSAYPMGAWRGDTLVAVACCSDRWLRLLAVHIEHRGQGVGSKLLSACEARIAGSTNLLRIMDQPGNYLSPGIDTRNAATIDWLEKRGYQAVGDACNLLIKLQDNPLVSAERGLALQERAEAAGYQLMRLDAERLSADADCVARAFSPGWAFEMRRSASADPSGVHIAIDGATGLLAGFAAHDGNNRGLGWFGPTGTLPEHRGVGIGAALLMACLLDTQAAGHSHSQVAWIGPREFYKNVAGIDTERHFTVMTKELHD